MENPIILVQKIKKYVILILSKAEKHMSNGNFARTITNLIESNSLNQLTFANAVKVNQSQVSDWISGKSKPSFEALRDICIRFKISADYLLGLKDEEPTTKFKIGNRRYTGSKLKLKDWIKELITSNCPDCASVCDIFAGTGVITDALIDEYNSFIVNDFLFSNEVIYKAFFMNEEFDLPKLLLFRKKYNDLDYDNLSDNYVSVNFGGKYFEYGEAKAIGYIRQDIEDNKCELNEREYSILMASLLYSFDKCANTVGHYEAYFKDKKIKRSFLFELITPYDTIKLNKEFRIYRQDANSLASEIKADIVYIDPPYSSRQYSRFYHVLENITKWEKPQLYGTALKPPAENMSLYCSSSARVAFSDLIEKLSCKYIVVSYNNTYNSKSSSSENKMTLEDIESILSKKGKTKRFEMPFKAFNAGKTDIQNHKEFIFITEVGKFEAIKTQSDIIRSPFFYVGDKHKLMKQLLPLFPENIETYYEPFCGGGSSFLNVQASRYILGDVDSYMIKLHNMLNGYAHNPQKFFEKITEIETVYGLSASYRQDIIPQELKAQYMKTYFAKFNKRGFENLRNDFNRDKGNIEFLYILLIYGFNRMLRFNSNGDFNLPVGNVDLNQNVIKALNYYFNFCTQNEVLFYKLDFRDYFKMWNFMNRDFVYLDPPYLISNSEYNKLWSEEDEKALLSILDELNARGIKFAISNLIEDKGKKNYIFAQWAEKYVIHEVSSNYINYHSNVRKENHREVLVTNYNK